MNNLLLSQWLLTVALLQYTGNVNGQFIAVPLTCSGNTVTYRCIVNGGGMNGITIWRVGGSSECTLAHRSAGNNARCGPQNAFTATPGSGFGTSATSYSSTLSGTATPTLNGTLVECFGPGVTRDADNMVGNSTLQILDPPSVSTLSCVDLFGDVSGAVNVTVNWTLSEGDSADFYLINITSNAPQIPYGGLLNITGSITQYQLTGFLAGYEYNITMHGVTENCGGQDSNTLRITLQVPATPMTDVCAVYDMRNETLQIIESSWNEVGNVTVSEHCTNGQDIQANYELSYKTESGTLITTCYVDGKECSHDTLSCHHELQSNTEDSRCQPPASHFSGDSLTVSVTARNIVGKSNPAVSRIISGRNVDLRVGIDATNLSSIFVECILNQRGFNCTIEYGTDPSYTNLDYTDTSSTQGRVTTITLSQELRGDTTYYYIVSAESISQCVRVLGRFQARCNETDLTNQSGTLNTASCTDIGFMNSSFISGGVVCYNGTTIGSRAVYICNDGFLIEGDEATRVCQKDGIWNGSIPQCIPNSNRIVGGVVGGVGVLLIVIIAIILICVLQIYRCKATKSKDLGSVRLIEGTDGSTHSEPQEVGSNDVPVPKKSIIDAIQGGHQSAVMGWLKKKDTKVNECIGGSAYYQPHAVADGTALHWAVYYGRLEIAELLLRYGADPHERAKGGTTVLHWACKSEKSDDQVLQFVFNIHVKSKHPEPLVNVPDSRGLTPLHVACSDNNKELVQLLLNAGADLDARFCKSLVDQET